MLKWLFLLFMIRAGFYWEIIEKLPGLRHDEVSDSMYTDMVKEVFGLGTNYTWTMEDIITGRFRLKGVSSPDEVFSFMDGIVPNANNAFLYDKRLIG